MSDTFRREYQPLDEYQKMQMDAIKKTAEELESMYNAVMENGYDVRMIKLAKTNLEQSVLWAVKAVTGLKAERVGPRAVFSEPK